MQLHEHCRKPKHGELIDRKIEHCFAEGCLVSPFVLRQSVRDWVAFECIQWALPLYTHIYITRIVANKEGVLFGQQSAILLKC